MVDFDEISMISVIIRNDPISLDIQLICLGSKSGKNLDDVCNLGVSFLIII